MNNNGYETDKYIFFYGGIYSQWAKKTMKIGDIVYNCCEQYMMSEKARLFGDRDAMSRILKVEDPALQKKIGRSVNNFDKKKWEENAKQIVFTGNYAKFNQNDDLKEQLLMTGDKIIVEASPWDCIWGVGLRATDEKILDPKNWRGTNWLGEAIMEVRKILKQLI